VVAATSQKFEHFRLSDEPQILFVNKLNSVCENGKGFCGIQARAKTNDRPK